MKVRADAIATTLALVGAAGAIGCASEKPQPLYASSASQGGYAERYPQQLGRLRGGFSEQESEAQRLMDGFSTYPGDLDDPSWDHVQQVVVLADESGKAAAYAHRFRENRHVEQFFEQEEQELRNKVAGATAHAAKKEGCAEGQRIGGAAVHALEKSVEKRLEERLRSRNEAHRFIEANQESLGEQNVEILQEQADEISKTSYLVHVAVRHARRQLQGMIEEADDIRETLSEVIEESEKVQQDPDRPDAEKAVAEERAEAARQAQSRLDSEVQQARHVLKEMEQRAEQLQSSYDEALEKLKTQLDELAAAAPAPADSAS